MSKTEAVAGKCVSGGLCQRRSEVEGKGVKDERVSRVGSAREWKADERWRHQK